MKGTASSSANSEDSLVSIQITPNFDLASVSLLLAAVYSSVADRTDSGIHRKWLLRSTAYILPMDVPKP